MDSIHNPVNKCFLVHAFRGINIDLEIINAIALLFGTNCGLNHAVHFSPQLVKRNNRLRLVFFTGLKNCRCINNAAFSQLGNDGNAKSANPAKRCNTKDVYITQCFEEIVDCIKRDRNNFVDTINDGIKVLGEGELTKKLTVKAKVFSASAKEKIEAVGGKTEVV